MTNQKNGFDRDALLLMALATLALVLVVSCGFFVYRFNTSLNEDIKKVENLYVKQLVLSESKGSFDRALKDSSDQLRKAAFVIGGDVNKVANEFQENLKTLFISAGLEVASTQILPSKSEGGVDEITLEVRVEGSYENIHNVLEALNSFSPRLYVRGMTLQSAGAIKPRSAVRMNGVFKVAVYRVQE